jgi:integrase
MARQFARAVERAKLDSQRVTPHTMRRTAITWLIKAKVGLPTVQRISGLKTLAMVLRYFHAHGDHVDTAIDVLGLALPGKTTPKLHTPAEQAPAEVVPIKATG